MTGKILAGAIAREKLRSIELRWFFRVLELWPDSAAQDPFDFLNILREKGLKITAAENGFIGADFSIHSGDISVALSKVKQAYRLNEEQENFDAESPWRDTEVQIAEGMPSSHKQPIGELWINEDDVAEACSKLGLFYYYWPIVKWPQSSKDIQLCTITIDIACRDLRGREKCAIQGKLSDEKRDVAGIEVEHVKNFWFELGFAGDEKDITSDDPKKRDLAQQLKTDYREETWKTYLPLQEAVNIMVGVPDGTSTSMGNPGSPLWLEAITNQKNWQVRQYLAGEDGSEVHCVHAGDLAQWAFQKGFHVHSPQFVKAIKTGVIPLKGYQYLLVTRIPGLLEKRLDKILLLKREKSNKEYKNIEAEIHEIEKDLDRFYCETEQWWEKDDYNNSMKVEFNSNQIPQLETSREENSIAKIEANPKESFQTSSLDADEQDLPACMRILIAREREGDGYTQEMYRIVEKFHKDERRTPDSSEVWRLLLKHSDVNLVEGEKNSIEMIGENKTLNRKSFNERYRNMFTD